MPDRMPVKTKRFTLIGDYDGWWCDIRINIPVGILLERLYALQTLIEEGEKSPVKLTPPILDLLEVVIAGWNFKDTAGNDLPCSREGMKWLDIDLMLSIVVKVKELLENPFPNGTS